MSFTSINNLLKVMVIDYVDGLERDKRHKKLKGWGG